MIVDEGPLAALRRRGWARFSPRVIQRGGQTRARKKFLEIGQLDIESLLKVKLYEKCKSLKLLALPTGIEPVFQP